VPSSPETTEHFNFVLLKNASNQFVAARFSQSKACASDVAYQAAAHVPLPVITMSKSVSKPWLAPPSRNNAGPQAHRLRIGVGAVYRRGLVGCQTLKRHKSTKISGGLWIAGLERKSSKNKVFRPKM
jgi:hypothetical protein